MRLVFEETSCAYQSNLPVIAKLALHYNKTHLGMGTDTGNVVLVDLESYGISKPKTKHSSVRLFF